MDYRRDTTPQGIVGKGQNQDTVEKNPLNKGDFSKPLFKRTQKIVTALYMVTDCLSDTEPVKLRLRTLGINALSDMRLLDKDNALAKLARFEDLKDSIDEMSALTEIAGLVGLISVMNSTILTNEFRSLNTSILEKEEQNRKSGFQDPFFAVSTSRDIVLPEDYFSHDSDELGHGKNSGIVSGYKGHNVKDNVLYNNIDFSKRHEGKLIVGNLSHKVQSGKNDIALKINRRNNILRLIRDKKEVTIKDISNIISDCSEKTIQRELNTLVFEGVLKKIGNKRWSRYALT